MEECKIERIRAIHFLRREGEQASKHAVKASKVAKPKAAKKSKASSGDVVTHHKPTAMKQEQIDDAICSAI